MTDTGRSGEGSLLRRLLYRAGHAYIVGPELEDAIACAQHLRTQGAVSSLCFWNSAADAPDKVAARYLATIDKAGTQPDTYVSIKAPALRFEAPLFQQVADAAQAGGVRLHIDSLGPEHTDRTFELIEAAATDGVSSGCTLPGRWVRSLADAERAIELGMHVRVVKGQWAGIGGDDRDPHQGFLDVVRTLAGRAQSVSVATHHPALAAEALRILAASGTKCELELLFGLPCRPVLNAVQPLRAPLRFYLPFGRAWAPYGLKQVTTSPGILAWFLRDLLLGPRPLLELQGKKVSA